MRQFSTSLPIDDALGALTDALNRHACAVLVAPPGAGKTTRVPLVVMDEPWAAQGRILVLEPRRIAARAAAARMAATLGEAVGETVGLRVRFGSKISRRTRVEVITEGVFTRLILDDPLLTGVAAVLFDEFHERSLDADLGLALACDTLAAREDLRLLVMSATLDGARVAKLLGAAPVIESLGRAYPVETRYVGREANAPIEALVADVVLRATRAETGSILAFLPGVAEINRTATRLRERLDDPAIDLHTLYGALDLGAQDAAIAPARAGRRKIVLATSLAETSITIDGVRVVIDSGLARVPRFEPDVGVTRLETVRVSRAAADQRRGRAGRTEPGICYRLWDEPQTASLEAYAKPEILEADLSGFMLDLAQWGAADPAALAFLDPPPLPALTEARKLLCDLDALDADGHITEEGKLLRQLPLPPRLARMVVDGAREGAAGDAALIAAIVTERGLGGNDIDIVHRLDGLRRDRSQRGKEARAMAGRWASSTPSVAAKRGAPSDSEMLSPGVLLALAYPDRIAKNRGDGSFVLVNGRGARVDPVSALARERFLVVAEITGTAAQGRVLLAAAITLPEIESRFADGIRTDVDVAFDTASASLRARRRRKFGALVLHEQIIPVPADADAETLFARGIGAIGLARLPWTSTSRQWRERVMFLRTSQRNAGEGENWPDMSDAALVADIETWLAPFLTGKTALSDIGADDLFAALQARVPPPLLRELDRKAPTHFAAPSGSRVPIDYSQDEGPRIEIRVQELFGLATHPTVGAARIPLIIALLSPARRPVQVTRDLPGFWRGSYAAVKAEMRGRYPRHPWPDDPASAAATTRVKPRGG
ncbi:MAG TPA: ATP-dependent helicase HrpB [Xanthobacteraceae bacterium]|jgi:ATP-dependent helicase HrpB|nr:ATP-dependent helicase HrpB [Xanthobacteraceae bacterium]